MLRKNLFFNLASKNIVKYFLRTEIELISIDKGAGQLFKVKIIIISIDNKLNIFRYFDLLPIVKIQFIIFNVSDQIE